MSTARMLLPLLLLALPCSAHAGQLVGIALDAKAELVDGDLHVLPHPPPDTAVFLEFDGAQAREVARVSAPTGFQGPPEALAISPDRRLALVAGPQRIDPADPARLVPADTLTVVDLAARPARVVQKLSLGATPGAVAIAPGGRTALVTHNGDDSVSVLDITDGRARLAGRQSLGKDAGPLALAFSPDGRRALVSFPERARIGVYAVERGRLVLPAIRELSAGVYPASLAWCSDDVAVVANYGRVTGDVDTVSLLDLAGAAPRVVDTASVGPSPEGIACSPDGRHVAVALQNMSTVPRDHPFHAAGSRVVLLRVEGGRLRPVAEASIGPWAQGVGFVDDATLFAQSMGDRTLHIFRIEGDALRVAAPIRFGEGAPAAFGMPAR
ncbi:MAG TPA: YncE family protein [Luteimonas sp.]|nr:YncE family protein [Luteimonas sp.]